MPSKPLWGKQTQYALENFPISGTPLPPAFLKALAQIKRRAAKINGDLGELNKKSAQTIQKISEQIENGEYQDQFPIDIYQTGSGTSSNMNMNEVIANIAGENIHPNDDVNHGQSSNDTIPTAIRLSVVSETKDALLPALENFQKTLQEKAREGKNVLLNGRTHLMEAMPISAEQRFSGYIRQIQTSEKRIKTTLQELYELPQGGTAVGTGINTHPEFGKKFAELCAQETGIPFREADNHFEAQASITPFLAFHATLRCLASDLLKILTDIRLMNAEKDFLLPTLQAGSSIMPGKVNPVLEEALSLVCHRIIGNDATLVSVSQMSTFELSVSFPLVAHTLLESLSLLANGINAWTEKSLKPAQFSPEKSKEKLEKNPILATTLAPHIGYERAAEIVKKAQRENRSIQEVAEEMTDFSKKELVEILDPKKMI